MVDFRKLTLSHFYFYDDKTPQTLHLDRGSLCRSTDGNCSTAQCFGSGGPFGLRCLLLSSINLGPTQHSGLSSNAAFSNTLNNPVIFQFCICSLLLELCQYQCDDVLHIVDTQLSVIQLNKVDQVIQLTFKIHIEVCFRLILRNKSLYCELLHKIRDQPTA